MKNKKPITRDGLLVIKSEQGKSWSWVEIIHNNLSDQSKRIVINMLLDELGIKIRVD